MRTTKFCGGVPGLLLSRIVLEIVELSTDKRLALGVAGTSPQVESSVVLSVADVVIDTTVRLLYERSQHHATRRC